MRLRDYPAALTRGTVNLVRRAASALSGSVPVRPSLWGWVRESFAGAWQQGVQISPLASILGFSPVYACASRIAADIVDGVLRRHTPLDEQLGGRHAHPRIAHFAQSEVWSYEDERFAEFLNSFENCARIAA